MTLNTIEDRIQQLLDERLSAEMGLDPDSVTVQSLENGVLSLKLSPGCLG